MSEQGDRILEIDDIEKRTIHIPEWDQEIVVRVLTLGERRRVSRILKNPKNDAIDIELETFITCTQDKDGNQLFERAQQDRLLKKHSGVIYRVANMILELSGLGGQAVEQAEKN